MENKNHIRATTIKSPLDPNHLLEGLLILWTTSGSAMTTFFAFLSFFDVLEPLFTFATVVCSFDLSFLDVPATTVSFTTAFPRAGFDDPDFTLPVSPPVPTGLSLCSMRDNPLTLLHSL